MTQSLRNARLAGNRIFLAFASALHEAIALLIAASSASDSLGAAVAVDMHPGPPAIKRASVPAHRILVGPSIMGSPDRFGARDTMCSIAVWRCKRRRDGSLNCFNKY